MKKIFGYVATLCLLAPLSGWAQRTHVRAAERLLQAEQPNYSEIRRLLGLAEAHEETKADPYTYYIRGLVDHQLYKAEYRKLTTPGIPGDTATMFRHVVDELPAWLRADSLDQRPNAQGRVQPRFTKRIQDFLKEDAPKMYDAGLFYLDHKDYARASRAFDHALQAQRLLLPPGERVLKADSTTANLAYYALVSAYTGKLYPEVIRLGKEYRDLSANQNEVYQFIARSHLAQQDTLGALPLLEEGARRFPKTTFFFGKLISIHQAQGNYKAAVALIDEAIKAAPTNPNLLVLRGNVYFMAQDWGHAAEVYKQVLKLSPDNYDALFNLGHVYYNQAVSLLANPLATKLDEHKAKDYFRQSLPHLEAAYKRSPDQVRELLGNVYYRLGLEQRYAELHQEKQ